MRKIVTAVGLAGAAAMAILLWPADEPVKAPAGSGAAESRATLRVYSSLPRSGVDNQPGLRDIELAVRLAVEEAGPRAGVHEVAYRSLDSGSEAVGVPWEVGRVQANARAAAADESAVAYIGEVRSGATAISMLPLARAGIPQITPTSTYVGLTRSEGAEYEEPDSYREDSAANLVRVIPGDHLQSEAQLQWLRALGVRRIALISDGEVYGDGLVEMLTARAPSRGVAVVATGRYAPRRLATIRDLVARVAARKPQAVVFTGIGPNRGAALWGRLHRALPRAWLMGTEGISDAPFLRSLRISQRRRTLITRPDIPIAGLTVKGKSFARAFERRFGRPPDPQAVFGYEAARVALHAIAKTPAGPIARVRRGVSSALFETRYRDSVLGHYSIDDNGDTTLRRYGAYRVTAAGVLRFDRVLER